MGHAFLWGDVTVAFKNGKSYTSREVLACVCAADLGACVKLAEAVPGVSSVDYRLD